MIRAAAAAAVVCLFDFCFVYLFFLFQTPSFGFSRPASSFFPFQLFPQSRYAAFPMLFHRASKVKSLVNPQLDSLRELLFNPFFYTKWETLIVETGLGSNILFLSLVFSLLVLSAKSGSITLDAIQQLFQTGQFGGNIFVVGTSCIISLASLAILAYGVALAPPPPEKLEEDAANK